MKRLAFVALAGLVVAAPAFAQGGEDMPSMLPGLDKAPPFTADVVITSRANPAPTAWHIAYMAQRVRLQSGGENGQTIITRLDQGTVFMSQGGNQWMQLSLSAVGGAGLMPGGASHSLHKTGQATVDGRRCDVYQSRSADGLTATTNYVYHDLPVRSIVTGPTGTTTVEYRNLQAGGVSASLFELPPHAEVMSMEGILDQAKGAINSQNQLGN